MVRLMVRFALDSGRHGDGGDRRCNGGTIVVLFVVVVMMVMAEAYRNKPVEKSKNFISELK